MSRVCLLSACVHTPACVRALFPVAIRWYARACRRWCKTSARVSPRPAAATELGGGGSACCEDANLFVLRPGVPLAQTPVDAHFQCLFQVRARGGDDAHGPDAHGNVIEHGLAQFLLERLYVFLE